MQISKINSGTCLTSRAACSKAASAKALAISGRRSSIQIHRAAASDDQLTYAKAGVDIDAGDELVKRIQKLNPSIGGFSGLVPFGDSYLVAGTDGVGTKLKLAFDMNKVRSFRRWCFDQSP